MSSHALSDEQIAEIVRALRAQQLATANEEPKRTMRSRAPAAPKAPKVPKELFELAKELGLGSYFE